MPGSRSIRRAIDTMDRRMKRHVEWAGEFVLWYEYDITSVGDPVYDEGPSRRWLPPKKIPVFFAYFRQEPRQSSDTGFYTVDTLHFTAQIQRAVALGISNVLSTEQHLKDRVQYEDRVYSVDNYQKQGLVHGHYMTLGVDAHEVKQDDQAMDAMPFYAPSSGVTTELTWRELAQFTWKELMGM